MFTKGAGVSGKGVWLSVKGVWGGCIGVWASAGESGCLGRVSEPLEGESGYWRGGVSGRGVWVPDRDGSLGGESGRLGGVGCR